MNKTKCTVCGKELEYSGFCCPTMCEKCNEKQVENSMQSHSFIRVEATSVKAPIATRCIICGELVELTDMEEMVSRHNVVVKVCDKCKQAVMKMRETIEHEGE